MAAEVNLARITGKVQGQEIVVSGCLSKDEIRDTAREGVYTHLANFDCVMGTGFDGSDAIEGVGEAGEATVRCSWMHSSCVIPGCAAPLRSLRAPDAYSWAGRAAPGTPEDMHERRHYPAMCPTPAGSWSNRLTARRADLRGRGLGIGRPPEP